MSENKKSAYRVHSTMLKEMITDYIQKHEGKNVESVNVTLNLSNQQLEQGQQDILSLAGYTLFTVTWDD